MFRFLTEVGAFVALQSIILGAVIKLSAPQPTAYMAAVVAKEELAKTTKAPRVILVGGSGLAFGMVSPMLREGIHREPINLGLQASLGLGYMLNQAERLAQPGDWVVLLPEYNHYYLRLDEALTIARLLEQSPGSWRDFPRDFQFFKVLLDSGLYFLRERLWRVYSKQRGIEESSAPYHRESFNREGDVVGHWEMIAKDHPAVARLGVEIDPGVVEQINSFAERAKSRGIRVWLAHPPLEAREFDLWQDSLTELQSTLDRDLNVPQLNRIDEMRYPDELFFDTMYHLTRPGAERRTQQLIERLNAAAEAPSVDPKTAEPRAAAP
jgi:hypothetical protein